MTQIYEPLFLAEHNLAACDDGVLPRNEVDGRLQPLAIAFGSLDLMRRFVP